MLTHIHGVTQGSNKNRFEKRYIYRKVQKGNGLVWQVLKNVTHLKKQSQKWPALCNFCFKNPDFFFVTLYIYGAFQS